MARFQVRRGARPLRRGDRPAAHARGAGLDARSLPGGSARMIRIANGQGFWGDWLEAPVRLLEQGPIDYLALDYLAEVTMAILQKQRQRNPDRKSVV